MWPGFLLIVLVALATPDRARAQAGAEGGADQGVETHEVRFLDASTGLDIPGASVSGVALVTKGDGRRALRAAAGRRPIAVTAPGYRSMDAVLDLPASGGPSVFFRLEPEPGRVRPGGTPEQRLARLLQMGPNRTLVSGVVGDERTGLALSGVQVRLTVGGGAGAAGGRVAWTATTDASGYFELEVPWGPGPASRAELRWEHPGYGVEARRNVVLWPGDDLFYRVRLERGSGARTVDEDETRRWRVPAEGLPGGTVPQAAAAAAAAPAVRADGADNVVGTDTIAWSLASGGGGLPPTVRVPRTIRVSYTNAVFYETLENYCRHVLPSEWYSSWGSYTGGSNSLQAGAVALRTYAIGYVHQPAAATYDICATTACQVYNPAVSTTRADQAVQQTAGWVMVNGSLSIPRGLTEYSAENNQLGQACGDGFTAPTGGCLADPVCAGEAEFGHGRGLCQWGSAKWATGLKFPGNGFSNTSLTNGQPRRDWAWIARHYYPALILVQGTPLVIGDAVRTTTANLTVRACAGGTITNGANCASLGTLATGTTGVIVGGPQQVTTDGAGYTWWQVQWSTGLTGWVVENYLARVIPVPPAPVGVVATPIAPDVVRLTWTDASTLETGFRIERSLSPSGPWTEAARVSTNLVSGWASNLAPATVWFFRVTAFNLAGDSVPSSVVSVTTPSGGLELAPVPDMVADEGQTLRVTPQLSGQETVATWADFEAFTTPPASGTVLFRVPGFSGSTSAFLESTPNQSVVSGTFPAGPARLGARVLSVSCAFTSASNAWLRLTTFGATVLPNPVIDFRQRLRLDVWVDRPVRLGLGLRETTNAPGTVLGADGGSAGAIEWVGITGRTNGQPQAVRTVPAGTWTTLTFAPLTESLTAYAGGNGVLATTSGLGVLEHLAIVPADGPGTYTIHLDNLSQVVTRPVTFGLVPGSAAGSVVDPATGEWSWTPTEAQGPGVYPVTVQVTDGGSPSQTVMVTWDVTVREVNQAPVLQPLNGPVPGVAAWLHGGSPLVLTNRASDLDLPANLLSFAAVGPWPSGAGVDSLTGVLTWATPEVATETQISLPLRVTDNGTPGLSSTNFLQVRLAPRPSVRVGHTPSGALTLHWPAVPGRRYQVQTAEQADAVSWTDLGPIVIAASAEVEWVQPATEGQRFFRVRALD